MVAMPHQHGETLTTAGAAKLLEVSPESVVAWSDAGEIPCWRTPGGHRRYRRSDLERFVAERTTGRPERRGTA